MPNSRRSFLVTTAGTAVASALGAAPSAASTTPSKARLRWLGNSGWRIDIGDRTLLVDPYLSRYPTGLMNGTFDPGTKLSVEAAAIAKHVGNPENILVTHAHWDHFNDTPHIAQTTGARVIGTTTVYNLSLAMGASEKQLVPVSGGEVLDFEAYTVEVISSLHSRNGAYSYAFPGVHNTPPKRPRVVSDLPEGTTLAFHVRITGGPSVFFMGASDFVERNITGLKPDIAMVPLNYSNATHEYIPRLMRALGNPATVVPVHWDNFEVPLSNPPRPDPVAKDRLPAFVRDIRRASPRTKVVMPEYGKPVSA